MNTLMMIIYQNCPSLTHLLDNDDGDNDTNDTHTVKYSPFLTKINLSIS